MLKKTFAALATVAALAAAPVAACPNFNLNPYFGSINLTANFLPDPQVRNITAGGTINLANCYFQTILGRGQQTVAGFVTTRPDFSLMWNGNSQQLTIAVESNADAILLVNAPDGRTWYYDDDYRGTNPAVTIGSPMIGRYDIWIGSYDGSRRNPGRLIFTEYNY